VSSWNLLDRLLAEEIVAIAKTYQVGSIVLPRLGIYGKSLAVKFKLEPSKNFPTTRKVSKTELTQKRSPNPLKKGAYRCSPLFKGG
jgi:hypothetical protein